LWGEVPERLLVTDQNGVVILTSEPQWRFKASRELSASEQQSIANHQPYTTIEPEPLSLKSEQWVALHNDLPVIDWRVSIFAPRMLINEPVSTAMAVFAVTVLAVLLIFGLLLQRRHYYLERIAMDAQAKQELEESVRNRTQDLQTLNSRLKEEVLEREATEQELVRTQDELVQAGKLSALGVMSASISHELNQPLAAIRSYTDNSKILLTKERYAEVASNLDLVAVLTERMASIIEHLRAFARRNPQASEHVALQPALEDALALVASRRNALQVEIFRDVPEATLWVEAGETRLRQVLSNLLANALDALAEKRSQRCIWLQTSLSQGWLCLTIKDNGTGFTDEALAQAREPFFTTKTSARGLGLGLAICDAIVKALGGRLEFANNLEGGACVRLYLKQIPSAMNLDAQEDRFA
ncbi:MAG: ATP-binding protein, partial [Thiopseudomonas sp.]|nr:ATP-binding protein [Thiopseudomonas sp.]